MTLALFMLVVSLGAGTVSTATLLIAIRAAFGSIPLSPFRIALIWLLATTLSCILLSAIIIIGSFL